MSDDIDKEFLDASIKVKQTVANNPLAIGLAVIIGNQESIYLPTRKPLEGPLKDVDSMNKAFCSLHFATLPVINASCRAILGLVHGIKTYFPQSSTRECYKRIVFAFAGHGDNTAGTDALHTKDGSVLLESDIILPLLPDKCPELDRIPKLFFIDACRSEVQVDAPVPRGGKTNFPLKANYYLVQSTQVQQKAMEDSSGGYWMQFFANELLNQKESYRGKNIQSLVINVNKLISEKMSKTKLKFLQQPLDSSTLHEDVCFIDEAVHFEGI